MKQKPLVQLRDSISTKLLRTVFSFYVFIAIAVTLAHMFSEYYNQKQDVFQSLVDLQNTFEQGIAVALWHYNQESLGSTLAGMLKVPVIVGFKLEDSEQKTIAAGGIIKDKRGYTRDVQLKVNLLGVRQDMAQPSKEIDQPGILESRLFWHTFPVTYIYEGQDINLGMATIYSGSDVIFNRVGLGFVMLIVNAAIKTLALWIIFLWFSRKYLSQPLAVLTNATGKLSLEELDQGQDLKIDVHTKGRNELKILEETFNNMLGKLQNAIVQRKIVESELRESEKKYRTLFESAPAGIAIASLQGQLFSFNQAFMYLFRYADKEAFSRLNLRELFQHAKDWSTLLKELENNNSLQNYEQYCIDVTGHVFAASLSVCLLQFDQGKYVQIILRNISQVKQVEAELRNYAQNLQEMVQEKTSELQNANKELTQALIDLDESQDRLSRNAHQAGMAEVAVSVLHNIGNMITPLNVRTESLKENEWPKVIESLKKIQGFLDVNELVLQNKDSGQSDFEKILEYLSTIILILEKNKNYYYADLEFIKNGLDHIAEVIAIQQKYAGVKGYEVSVNINTLIRDAVEMLSDCLKKRNIHVDYELGDLPEIKLDRNKMLQILINLIKNAYEAIDEQPLDNEKQIYFATKLLSKPQGEFVEVKISDTGAGIEPAYLDEIYNFSYSTKGRGSGFGLHDAANYIKAKSGEIQVYSQGRGHGAQVVLQLPVNSSNGNDT